ncbi:hypothetical protein ACGFIF_16490 [Kribbella sp. NPDC049174]|uniref:hypothetical protein n=1 Tax=Kribbella sp. NPDC049174 TaxID=3364112 RepID=UPI00371EBFA6
MWELIVLIGVAPKLAPPLVLRKIGNVLGPDSLRRANVASTVAPPLPSWASRIARG